MKICLVGYGRMGHEIERVALSRGHEIVGKIDGAWNELPQCDVAIEFTQPDSALGNITKALEQGVPVVSGTTGWLLDWDKAVNAVDQNNGTLFYASNFSVGIYLFRQINRQLARMMNRFSGYEPMVEEVHHIHKLDYPSGTALTLANEVVEQLASKTETLAYLAPSEMPEHASNQLLIRSVREDEVPGTHIIHYESAEDNIEIKHEAKGRAALALGAVLAAEFVQGKKGLFGMEDLIPLD
ncbi:4-hydroxy-tetrahydrodipicolinate reductase [Porphyromonas levii]|uniref:4-hydroxy-tetrahydrodipicolinate reductase n=1 Tax=Porphyromonas levii TaxID=28114 RepID=UPI001B8D1DFA|nr:4-hydroxy-tetrahydrodipicolinate reductase [Porphyromonas levii]MBR8769520.1 4-hydroxy-tetrahydrodipicolinate reductase [Porphyromonas levii]MBR8784782.1 4-hydroxy-tetrahydrodipicolinate reductase [Porphyromonas levii]